ncbi:piggyBac transposable element-derived protein 4-like [Bicyclus anynana]|uniref:PiggyBac transposable element-derived protein 4-like n=1 Tax=Bicyclus anynana TaxID=110368 RepID=A0A6J1NKG1_BICAN|nr:piggyBac transposable element-derived protein 4-like [Bicyclus anynana]
MNRTTKHRNCNFTQTTGADQCDSYIHRTDEEEQTAAEESVVRDVATVVVKNEYSSDFMSSADNLDWESDLSVKVEEWPLDEARSEDLHNNAAASCNTQNLLNSESITFGCTLCNEEYVQEDAYNEHMIMHLQDTACDASHVCEPRAAVSRSCDSLVLQNNRKSFAEELKEIRAQDRKRRANLNPDQQQLTNKRDRKQDAPKSKKGKGKEQGDNSRIWVASPLAPGTPSVPPAESIGLWKVPRDLNVIIEDSDNEVEDSPHKSLPKRIKRDVGVAPDWSIQDDIAPIMLPPSTGMVQVTEPPVNPVPTFEFIGLSPKSSSTPGSAVSQEIDDNLVCDPIFVQEASDSGSDSETEGRRTECNYTSHHDNDVNDTLVEDVARLGACEDIALRALTEDNDLLHFDWRGDIDNFKGERETFTASAGPTFDVTGQTPFGVFSKIWDAQIIDLIVRETNRYASRALRVSTSGARISQWKDTSAEEIWRFLAILMLQSLVVNNVDREYWYPKFKQLRIGEFDKIMPYNRFLLVKKCLHFVDNDSLPKHPSKLHKIMPVIDHLNKQFSSLYLPEQNVVIDESLLLWKGRLSFAQLIATKKAKIGVKSFELCESRTGYLWRMVVYAGKSQLQAQQEAIERDQGYDLENATSKIVFSLMRPLFGKGHTVVMDSYYNAPLLSRVLKAKHRTDTMGTLRLYREFVPEALKRKTSSNMRQGEVCVRTTRDLSVIVWKDRSAVALISTFHRPVDAGKDKHGLYKNKPKVVLDYNLCMAGVDHKDQMLDAFPMERSRNVFWYKKLFRRLLNVSIHNAMVIFNHGRTSLGNRDFRVKLVEQVLQTYCPGSLNTQASPAPPTPDFHIPDRNATRKRCKLCYQAKLQKTTMWRCNTCRVNLCILGCYRLYHEKYMYK